MTIQWNSNNPQTRAPSSFPNSFLQMFTSFFPSLANWFGSSPSPAASSYDAPLSAEQAGFYSAYLQNAAGYIDNPAQFTEPPCLPGMPTLPCPLSREAELTARIAQTKDDIKTLKDLNVDKISKSFTFRTGVVIDPQDRTRTPTSSVQSDIDKALTYGGKDSLFLSKNQKATELVNRYADALHALGIPLDEEGGIKKGWVTSSLLVLRAILPQNLATDQSQLFQLHPPAPPASTQDLD